jgi:anti-sigma regulatory factor (Ser/Thr protein kinase)
MPRNLQRTDDLLIAVPSQRDRIHEARTRFAEWLGHQSPDPDLRDDLAIVVSELLANAITAAAGESPVVLHALRRDDDVHICVTNPMGTDPEPGAGWDLDDPLRTGGRGLMIVGRFTDDVDVEIDLASSRTTVRCRRHLE